MTTRSAHVRLVDGQVDDIAIQCDMFRLERMDRGVWWACAARNDGTETHFWLRYDRKRRDIIATCTEDSIGCDDDTGGVE